MAANNKGVNQNLILGAQIMEMVNTGRLFKNKLDTLKPVLDAMTDGSDVALIATRAGILNADNTPNTAMANDLWYLINNAKAALDAEATFAQLLSWITPNI